MSLKSAIKLAEVFNQRLNVGFDINGNYLVGVDFLYIKSGGLLGGVCSRGASIEVACEDFLLSCSGRRLKYEPPQTQGKVKEIFCVRV